MRGDLERVAGAHLAGGLDRMTVEANMAGAHGFACE